jgi:hypothetical protein
VAIRQVFIALEHHDTQEVISHGVLDRVFTISTMNMVGGNQKGNHLNRETTGVMVVFPTDTVLRGWRVVITTGILLAL